MIRDPCAAAKTIDHGARGRSRGIAQSDRGPVRERPGKHVGEAGRGRQADLQKAKRRKALAADRPPEGLRCKGSPSPKAARGEKGGGNLGTDVAGEDAALGQFFEGAVLNCSRLERRRGQGLDFLGDPLQRRAGLEGVEQDRLGGLELGIVRLEFGRG
jgi:hypothetical protein